jgi:hypothetical protein
VSWYGDPQKEIMWWPQVGTMHFPTRRNLGASIYHADTSSEVADHEGGALVWHLFDQAAGIDAGNSHDPWND